jgi:hypothetical protein
LFLRLCDRLSFCKLLLIVAISGFANQMNLG